MASLMLRTLCNPQINPRLVFSQFQKRNIFLSRYLRQENKNELPKKSMTMIKSPMTWKSFAISGVVGCIFLGYLYYLQQIKDLKIDRERRRALGKASIGGKFELINPKGELVKSDDFLGQWVLIYFGFTHCPDICPDEVEKMIATVDLLEKNHDFKIQPIFISVDPDRDTPAVVEKYCREFSEKIIGLTGSRDQVAKACKAYRVYFSNGPKDSDSDYIVDHTIIMYLIDPDGFFVDYYGQTNTADQIVSSIVLHQAKLARLKNDSPWWPSLSLKTSDNPA